MNVQPSPASITAAARTDQAALASIAFARMGPQALAVRPTLTTAQRTLAQPTKSAWMALLLSLAAAQWEEPEPVVRSGSAHAPATRAKIEQSVQMMQSRITAPVFVGEASLQMF